MARLALKDRAQDRLGAALAVAATSLVLGDVSDFVSTKLTPPFLVIVDSGNTKEEIMLVTAVTELTKTLTVERDMLGTTDVAHAKGALVVHTGTPIVLQCRITDISTGGTEWLMPPKCVVVEAWCCISAAISVADSIITLYKEAQVMTNGVITVAQPSAIGGVFKCNPTVYTEFDGVDDYLKVISGGESTTASVGQITIIAMME